MVKKFFVYIILCGIPCMAFSQEKDKEKERVEITARQNTDDYQVVPMEDKGVVVFNLIEKTFNSNREFTFTFYNKALKEVWQKELVMKNRSHTYQGYETDGDRLYLLFTRWSSSVYYLVEVNVSTSELKVHELNSLKKLEFNDFKVLDQRVFLTGEVKRVPVLLHLSLKEKEKRGIRVLPTSFTKRTELEGLEKDTVNQLVNLTAVNWRGKNGTMTLYSFYSDGEPAFAPITLDDDHKNLLTAKMFLTGYQQSVIVGTFANNKTRLSDGLYIAGYNGEQRQYINYYSFAQMDHFFDYLSDRKQTSIKRKQEKKSKKGKDVNLQMRLLVHDLIRKDDQYTLVAEAYYRVYETQRREYFYGGRYYTRYEQVFAGYRYTHAMVAGFSTNGKLLWDNSIELERRELYPKLEPMVKVGFKDNNELKLSYSYEGEIRSKLIHGSEVLEGQTVMPIAGEFGGDKVKRSDEDNLAYWYGNYFLAYGFQKIKNMDNEDVKNKRKVFYLNKISF